ncbi:MAG: alpha/beta hydrolase [Halioglobus sp.]
MFGFVARAISAVLLLVISIVFSTSVSASQEGWSVESRALPLPQAASKPLRDLIANGIASKEEAVKGVPTSPDEWRKAIAARSAAGKISLAQLGQQLNTTITRDTVAGVPVHRVEPAAVSAADTNRLFIYLHGGAYVFGGGDAAVMEGAMISALTGVRALSVDYRMPPDHPSPAAAEDVVAVYAELLKTYEPKAIAMGGTSAGGGLTLSAVQAMKAAGLPLPGALYLGTPWTDLSKTSDSLYTNEGIDRVLVVYDGLLEEAAKLYAGGKSLKDPAISPVYGDFADFPPSFLVTGTRDMFLSDTVRAHRKLRQAGIVADLHVFEGLSHAEYARLMGSPEWEQTYSELSRFLQVHLSQAAKSAP